MATKPIAVWRGTKDIKEQPGSPDYTENAAGEKYVRTFRGPYQTLFNTRPRKGGTMIGYAGFYVDEVNCHPDASGKSGPGTLVVTLINDSFDSESPTVEIEWVEVRQPAEQAPIFAAGGAKQLTDVDLDKIAEWKAADTSVKRTSIYGGMSANAKYFTNKLRRGQDTYVVYAPVHRSTTRSFRAPGSSKCGKKVGTPTGAPAGYEWLQTADRAVRQGGGGKFERSIEKTGADVVDTDFYPAG
jgi:hypothetical protein